MSTLADELLQDFEDSGSDAGGDDRDDSLYGISNGDHANSDMLMEEYKDDDDDDAMQGVDDSTPSDSEDTKAKIERMQLGGVRDVRTVASLMKTLTPVLEVS